MAIFAEQTIVIAEVVRKDFVEAADEWKAFGALRTLDCLAIDAETN